MKYKHFAQLFTFFSFAVVTLLIGQQSSASTNSTVVTKNVTNTNSTTVSPGDSASAATALTAQVLYGGPASVSSSDTITTSDSDSKTGTVKNTTSSTTISTTNTSASKTQNTKIKEVSPISSEDLAKSTTSSTITNVKPKEVQNELSLTLSEPLVVKAENLLKENNPKLSGTIDNNLSITSVNLVKKDDGGKKLIFSGKAYPKSIVSLYVFSNDPMVISVNTDINGNWNYELSKDLEDGKHEVFVAVIDASGKVLSKGEPFAFIKTAQAATAIPVSALAENASPMERSSSQYVLVAIFIMVIFLVIALALIGIITHKRNIDERIN